MFISARNLEQIETEVEAVEEYCQRVFSVAVDYVAFREQVRTIIQSRIQDYIFQRFRDWPIPELLKLENSLNEKVKPGPRKKSEKE